MVVMARHNELGAFGEEMAAAYLQQKGYEILERNWKFRSAEVDIMAKKDNTLAVVEVKTRSSIEFGLPQDFVKPKKIRHLLDAVNEYITSNDLGFEVRFDIMAIHKDGDRFIMDHLEDAFFYF